MTATFRLNIDELDIDLIERMKALFAHHEIGITILEQDATEYLMSDSNTSRRILEAVADLKEGRNLIEIDRVSFSQDLGRYNDSTGQA